MAYNVISCIEVAEITQTYWVAESRRRRRWIGMSYIGWFHVKEHVQSFQNMYGKGG